jgi:hypothetical protein
VQAVIRLAFKAMRIAASAFKRCGYPIGQGYPIFFLRRILARRNAAHCFMGGPKRRKQPERYVPFFGKFCEKNYWHITGRLLWQYPKESIIVG